MTGTSAAGDARAKRPNRPLTVDSNGIVGHWSRRLGEWQSRPGDPDWVRRCRQFLAQCDRTKTGRIHSYRLKHIIENACGQYVSNGACIQAALDLGLVVEPLPYGPNAYIGVSRRSVRQVSNKMGRPDAMEAV